MRPRVSSNNCRCRWRIEGLFGRLESVLNSEIRTLGHPRAALLAFATAILAYNVLSLLKRCIEEAHREQAPELDAPAPCPVFAAAGQTGLTPQCGHRQGTARSQGENTLKVMYLRGIQFFSRKMGIALSLC